MGTTILALEKDLFFSVKIRDTLRHHDMDVTVVRNLPSFEQHLNAMTGGQPVVVLVNSASKGVDWEEAIRQARAKHYPVLTFGSHMDLEAREKALQAGAQKVVANSKFVSDMPGLITRLLTSTENAAKTNTQDEETGFEDA